VRFLNSLTNTRFSLIAIELSDILRTTKILEKYLDARIDFVDATVIAIAERLEISYVLTLDRRDFMAVRPQHISFFELLP
jgi:predicted nucleic acid-binding protein